MKVLFASSEIVPFAKSGGLADVAAALPKALSTSLTIARVMPLYGFISKERLTPTPYNFSLQLGGISYEIVIYHSEQDGMRTYFIQAPLLSDTQHLYGDHEAYANNDLRFGIFSKALVYLAQELHIDILHLNDWHSALAALWLKEIYPQAKSIFTIHNLAYQGIFEKESLKRLGISETHFTMEDLEFYGQCNFMKAGIKYANAITTVSPHYAKEILSPEFGCGLDGFLNQHKKKLTGIINGLDTTLFNAKSDPALIANFDEKTLKNKNKNKSYMLKETKLKDIKRPLFIMISRLTEQKGFDILLQSLDALLAQELNLLLLVDGASPYQTALQQAADTHPNMALRLGFDENLSHQIYAAADFFLMPSHFEPCGLAQMISYRYGVIPIVRDTGGLHDSVHENSRQCGQGIRFKQATGNALKRAINRALILYHNTKKKQEIQRFNLHCDFSFEHSAREYQKLYQAVLS
ncbi:glycogen synthase [Sulfurospirillum sp. 1612]|uniref:glycogen synthase n=1 Tax=Sulfurospirillum sp. 1612 TaxID=3094835 RepID=UPI002F95CF77